MTCELNISGVTLSSSKTVPIGNGKTYPIPLLDQMASNTPDAVLNPSSIIPSWIMEAEREYVTPVHISLDCIADISTLPSGRIPFTAPRVPSFTFKTLKL